MSVQGDFLKMGISSDGQDVDIFNGRITARNLVSFFRNVYYVDPTNGDDSYDGKKPETAFATMQKGINSCTAGKGDVIIRMPGTETVTSTINFNKSGIIVLTQDYGLSPPAKGEYFATLADESFTDGPVATITERCTIKGLGFVSRDTGSTFYGGAAVLVGGDADGAFGVHLIGCRFPKWGLDNRIGIALAGGDSLSECVIERCTFEGVGSALDVGIYLQGAVQNPVFKRNYFRQCTAAIQAGAFAGGGPHMFVHENFVEDGLLFDSQDNTGNGLIAGNWLETAAGSSYDQSVATLQGNGWQFSDNHYTES